MTEVRPFRVEISDAVIDDLRERLARTRWPEKEPVEDWSMGIPLGYVQELAAHWADSYDMRRVADLLNRYEQYRTAIDDDTHAHAIWGMHDYIKTPVVNFNGYGHISHDYLKVDGQWKIIRGRTTRLIVDEEWLTEPR